MPLFAPPTASLVHLGSTELTTAAASTAVVGPFAGYKWLTIYACVSGYASGGGIFSLQFGIAGGAIDTGARYRWKVHVAPTTTSATWGTGAVSSTTTAASMMQLANAAITGGRVATIQVMNRAASTQHTAWWVCTNEASSAIAHPLSMLGDGSYISATAGQITSVQMLTNSGGGNLNSGTGFSVFGVPG